MAFDELKDQLGARGASNIWRSWSWRRRRARRKWTRPCAYLEKGENSAPTITAETVKEAMGQSQAERTEVNVVAVDLRLFDQLCGAGGEEVVQ